MQNSSDSIEVGTLNVLLQLGHRTNWRSGIAGLPWKSCAGIHACAVPGASGVSAWPRLVFVDRSGRTGVPARTDFTRLLQENLTVLENVKKSTQRLVDKILDVARQSVTDERHHAYAASGKAQAARSSSLSLSIDKSL